MVILQNHQKTFINKVFGTRFEPNNYDFKEEAKEPIKDNNFPIEIFPKEIQYYIKENTEKLGLISDFMGSGMLWLASSVIGNSLNIQIKKRLD